MGKEDFKLLAKIPECSLKRFNHECYIHDCEIEQLKDKLHDGNDFYFFTPTRDEEFKSFSAGIYLVTEGFLKFRQGILDVIGTDKDPLSRYLKVGMKYYFRTFRYRQPDGNYDEREFLSLMIEDENGKLFFKIIVDIQNIYDPYVEQTYLYEPILDGYHNEGRETVKRLYDNFYDYLYRLNRVGWKPENHLLSTSCFLPSRECIETIMMLKQLRSIGTINKLSQQSLFEIFKWLCR